MFSYVCAYYFNSSLVHFLALESNNFSKQSTIYPPLEKKKIKSIHRAVFQKKILEKGLLYGAATRSLAIAFVFIIFYLDLLRC